MKRPLSALLIASLLAVTLPAPLKAQTQQREPFRNPYLRASQSLVIPGWGQWANGDAKWGAIWFFDSVLALMFASKFVSFGGSENSIRFWRTAGWVAFGVNAATSSVGAYRQAKELNIENGYDLDALEPSALHHSDAPTRLTLISLDF